MRRECGALLVPSHVGDLVPLKFLLWAKYLLVQPGNLLAVWLLQERGLSAHPSRCRDAAMPGCSGAWTGRRAELWEAPGTEHFDSQKSNYRAADYRANKIPLCYFGK